MNDANEQHHSIKEMVFDVRLNSEDEAFNFQRGFSDLIKNKLMSITEKIFDELAPPDQLVKINSLTIDLETVELKRFEKDIPELYEKQLRETLGSLLFRLKGITYSAVDDASTANPEISLSQLLSFFLRTGTIPWFAKSTWQTYLKQKGLGSEVAFSIGRLFEIVFEKNPELFSQLIERHQTEPMLLYRLADQIPNHQLLQVIKLISPEKITIYERILQDIAKVSNPRLLTLHHSQARVLVWQTFFLNWEQNNETVLVDAVVEKLFSMIQQKSSEGAQYILQLNLERHQLQTNLAQSLKKFTSDTPSVALFTSKTKTLQLLQQIVSEKEGRMLQAFVKRLMEIAPGLPLEEVWGLTLDYLSENRGQPLQLSHLVTQVLPQLTSEWRNIVQKLQIELEHHLFTVEEFDQAIFNDVIESNATNVIHFLGQILQPEQATWANQYGNQLAQALGKPITSVWEVLLEIFWENRKKTFSRDTFLKQSFLRVWKKLVKVVPVNSPIPALNDKKMWERPPIEVIQRLSETVPGFSEVKTKFWTEELKSPETSDQPLTESQQELEEVRLKERKQRLNQALNEGKIREFMEQVLPGQSIWLEQYVAAVYRVIKLDKIVVWELILEELWEKRAETGGFNQRTFLIGSFSRIMTFVSSKAQTFFPPAAAPDLSSTSTSASSTSDVASPSLASDASSVDASSAEAAATAQTRANIQRWKQIKIWIEQLAQNFPSFAQVQEEASIARYYEGIHLKREEIITQPIGRDIREIVEKLFTKGILPAAAQTQRQLGIFLRRPLISMEETITNLVEFAITQTDFSVSQLLEPLVLQRFIEQTTPTFVQELLTRLQTIDPNLSIPDLASIASQMRGAQEHIQMEDKDQLEKDRLDKDPQEQDPSENDLSKDQLAKDKQLEDELLARQRSQGQSFQNKQLRIDQLENDQDALVYYLQYFLQSGTLPDSLGINIVTDATTGASTDKDTGTGTDTTQNTGVGIGKEVDANTGTGTGTGKEAGKGADLNIIRNLSTSDKNYYVRQLLVVLRNKHPEDFQRLILALGTTDVDRLINAVPEASKWISEVWQKTTDDYQTSSQGRSGQATDDQASSDGRQTTDSEDRRQSSTDQKNREGSSRTDDDSTTNQTEEERKRQQAQQRAQELQSEEERAKKERQQQTTEEKEKERLERETFERIKQEILESTRQPKQELTNEVLYVENAGLVILHPYLIRLFEVLKLTESVTKEQPSKTNPQKTTKKTQVDFKGDAERERAVYVLQYLASKSEAAEEHELVLNKILCGMEVTTPFASGKVTLTDEEKETCDGLLAAVVQNWTVLGDSPPDMLRGSFFMREGRLEMKSADWRMKVEESGIDVLLQQLPWSIGMVKLPWMETMLNVEWM